MENQSILPPMAYEGEEDDNFTTCELMSTTKVKTFHATFAPPLTTRKSNKLHHPHLSMSILSGRIYCYR